MKFLFDFFPVLLFFIAYKFGGMFPESTQAFAQKLLGSFVSHGTIDAKQAPILIATLVAIIGTGFQIGYLIIRKRKIDTMLWVSAFIIVFFGGMTIYFNDEVFIKWKPTMIYWSSALIFGGAQLFFKKNMIREMMSAQFELPEPIWIRLLLAWIGFFFVSGLINLGVAFSVKEFSTWVNFKTFGMPAIMFVFVLGQGLLLSKYMKEVP
jgi:intracellular septation protein